MGEVLIRVSKKRFFDAVMASKRNIHPSPERLVTKWKDQHNGALVGRSPGYSVDGGEYLLSRSMLDEVGSKEVTE